MIICFHANSKINIYIYLFVHSFIYIFIFLFVFSFVYSSIFILCRPYTEETLVELGASGVKNLVVVPVSFVSEHIETLVSYSVCIQ